MRLRGLEGGAGSLMAVTCGFRFEVRPEDEVVVLEANHHTVHVCVDCLTLLTVHRRIHHMKVEKVPVPTGLNVRSTSLGFVVMFHSFYATFDIL